MIKAASDMLRALRRGDFTGVVLWEGKSALDGAPIAAIACRITEASDNSKTGDMVQTFIIRTDIPPLDALKTGADQSVCGFCKHRPYRGGRCYVQVGRAPTSVYDAYHRGRYARPGRDYERGILPALFQGLVFRLGSYGDPCAVPFSVWRLCTIRVAGQAGYTHQWRDFRFQAFRLLCMASVDSEDEAREAHAMGWRTFRVRLGDEALMDYEISCAASGEMGHKTTCADCQACGGTEAKARVNITIISHGPGASGFALTQARAAL